MSRPRQYKYAMSIGISQLERALVSYYAHRYKMTKGEVIRRMIAQFPKMDEKFNLDEFKTFVDKQVIPEEEENRMREEIRGQVKEFIALHREEH